VLPTLGGMYVFMNPAYNVKVLLLLAPYLDFRVFMAFRLGLLRMACIFLHYDCMYKRQWFMHARPTLFRSECINFDFSGIQPAMHAQFLQPSGDMCERGYGRSKNNGVLISNLI
jgi:hypothetical protein